MSHLLFPIWALLSMWIVETSNLPLDLLTPSASADASVKAGMIDIPKGCGYSIQEYKVKTKDGYNLTLFKIWKEDLGEIIRKTEPILLMHGLFSTSFTFILRGCHLNIPFTLADLGYTVWLGNTRGNLFANEHNEYKFSQSQFWNFSWQQMSELDLPEILEFVYEESFQQRMIYIGHSRGTLIMFAYASTNPAKAKKYVSKFLAMAPVYYLKESYFTKLLSATTLMDDILDKPGNFAKLLRKLSTPLLITCGLSKSACIKAAKKVGLAPVDITDPEVAMRIIKQAFQGTSSMDIYHLYQIKKEGFAKKYDYGRKENFNIYGSDDPPAYSLDDFPIPTYLFAANEDKIVRIDCVERLEKTLGKSLKKVYFYPGFRHGSFQCGQGLEKFLHDLVDAVTSPENTLTEGQD